MDKHEPKRLKEAEDKGIEILRFNHEYKGFNTELRVVKQTSTHWTRTVGGRSGVELEILDPADQMVGKILGYWRKNGDEVELQSAHTSNEPENDSQKHIPRVIGATITQLLRKEIISVWRSDFELSPQAINMYTWLSHQEGLLVKSPTPETHMRFMVTRTQG